MYLLCFKVYESESSGLPTHSHSQRFGAGEARKPDARKRPILRGRDIRRYAYDWAGLYLIATFPALHLDIDDYPAVRDYLLTFGKTRLEQTGKTTVVNGVTVKARKRTSNQWFETQDTIAYMDDFAKPQIVWIELSDTPKFALARNIVSANTVFFMTGQNLQHILGCLNSRLSTWYFQHCKGTTSGVGTNRWLKYTIEQLPIPPLSEELKVLVEMHSQNPQPDTDMKIERQVSKLFCITQEEMDYVASHV